MHRPLLLTENYPPDRGGMAESCDRIVRGLRSRGVVVDVIHFDRRAVRSDFRANELGSHLRWPVEVNAAHAINCLWNRLRQNFDLEASTHVIAFGGALPIAAAPLYASLMHRPLVTLLRGSEFDAGLFDTRRRPFLDEALRRSVAICTVTSEQEEKVCALYEGARVHLIPNGIDFELWKPTEADHERASSERASFNRPRAIGLFGDLKAKKGIPFFLEVLRRGFSDRFHVLLVGEVDEELAAYLDGHQDLALTRLPSRDRFDLMHLYLACDFVALPSHYDGFPNVLIEAAALGVPIIAAAVGGMRDILIDGEDAFIFEAGDEHDCRRAIHAAAKADEATLRRMGERAMATVRQRCNSVDEAAGYLRVLELTELRRIQCAEVPSS